MNAALLIERLASLEQNFSLANQTEMRAFVIDAQDCVLRMQEEILQLRQLNLSLYGTIETLNLDLPGELMQLLGIAPSTPFAA